MKSTKEYELGFDYGLNGPSEVNCSFLIFSTKEKLKRWEAGRDDAIKQINSRKDSTMNTSKLPLFLVLSLFSISNISTFSLYAQDRVTGLYDAKDVDAALSNMENPTVTCVCNTNNGRNIQAPMEGVSVESCEQNEGKLFQVNANGKTDQVATILDCGLRASRKGYTEQDIASRVKAMVSASDDRINAVRDYAFNQISDLQQQIESLRSNRPAFKAPTPTEPAHDWRVPTPGGTYKDPGVQPRPNGKPIWDFDGRLEDEFGRGETLILNDSDFILKE